MESWQKLLLAAGGAAGAAAVLYFLFKDDPEGDAAVIERAVNGDASAGGISKVELIQILQEMSASQRETSGRMKSLAAELSRDPNLSFDDLYEKVRGKEPADPLEKRGITMNDLDVPLQANQNDPQVMMAMQELMSGGPLAPPTGNVKDVSVAKLTEVNLLMVEELQAFIEKFQQLPKKSAYDMKTVMIALQATLDAKVLAKFGYSSEELQAATQAKQSELGSSKDFIESHEKMQALMEAFVKSIQSQR